MTRPDPDTQAKVAPSRMSRRSLFVFGAAAVATGGAVAAQWFNIFGTNSGTALTPEAARAAALSGKIVLVDVRRPDEWRRTGVGEGAVPIDMRREDFEDAVRAALQENPSRPVALICARGVRSRRMTARLEAAGFGDVIDVPEGMLGSGAGPGWLRRGLPVVAYP